MAIKYTFIGWCSTGGHDKVWGIIQLTDKVEPGAHSWEQNWTENDYVVVWGRRGKALQTKVHKNSTKYAMGQLADKKQYKSKPEECYKEVDKTKLDEVYPEFEKDLRDTAFWSSFKV